MSKHFDMISELNSRFDEVAETPIGDNEKDKLLISELLIHGSDLSNATRPYNILHKWAKYVNQEFTLQTEAEKRLYLPVTEYMLRLDEDIVFYKNEMGFNKFFIKPLWTCMNRWLNPHISFMMDNLENNINTFQEEYEKLK